MMQLLRKQAQAVVMPHPAAQRLSGGAAAAETPARSSFAVARRDVALAYRGQDTVQRLSLSQLGVRTAIDEAVDIEGQIVSATSVAIKGRLKGELRVRGETGLAVIFPGARVEGRVRARYVWLAGELSGRVECQRLLVLPGGRLDGDSVCESLEIKHGAEYFPSSASKEPFRDDV